MKRNNLLGFDTLEESNDKLLEELGKDEFNLYDFWFMKLESSMTSSTPEGHTA